MEIALLALALLLAGKNSPNLSEGLAPLGRAMESGDVNALLESDWFRAQDFGGVRGSDLARAAKTLQTLQKSAVSLRDFADGGNPAALLKNFDGEGVAALAGGAGMLAQMFGGLGAAANAASGAPHGENTEAGNPLAPVADIANEEIIYALNRYFAAPEA